MVKGKNNARGFTLIAALMLTILLSGVAVGLLYMVSNETRMGGNDLEGNLAYYGAEAGIENLTSQLSLLYQSSQSPNAASITALTNPANFPTQVSGSNIQYMNYAETITWPSTQTNGTPCPNAPDPCGSWDIVGSGSNQGMVASLIPFTLQVTATRQAGSGQTAAYSTAAATGASVNLTRTVEVALLPAFEFGIFCDGDCDYFAGPNFNFGGRVHTNSNLFLASGSNLTFTDKIAAVGQVILDQLENGHPTSSGYTGKVFVPNAAGGCPGAPGTGPATHCQQLPAGSWTGGFPNTGTPNTGWTGISKVSFASFIENGLTGAKALQLPFVQNSTVGAIDIIRKPQAGDSQLLSSSRLYNKAEIRILLADNINDLHPERSLTALDADDVQIGPATQGGSAVGFALTQGPYAGSTMYYAMAKKATGNWLANPPSTCASGNSTWPLLGQVTQSTPCTGVWLRVEYLNNAGAWVGVTREWLGYGFGRPYNYAPTAPYQYSGTSGCPVSGNPAGLCYNPISPAILILQQLQSGVAFNSSVGSTTSNNWLPINFYDAREGEPRDSRGSGNNAASCSPNGVMNSVELDVGNLWLWLQGSGPFSGGSGRQVNSTNQNGYILYFSDRRGMQPDPNITGNGLYNRITGMSGLEDIVNSTSSTGIPDGTLEPITYYNTPPNQYSPEDVNDDGFLDTWGAKYLGVGFGLPVGSGNMSQAYYIPGTTTGIANCSTTAFWNMVTGPRHNLRLVDGGMDGSGNSFLPHPIAPATTGNGFTVASEEPVYVYGNYNSAASDPFFTTAGANATTPHSAAAIIADSVTLLSNPPISTGSFANLGWTDLESFTYPATATNRNANTSYYRMAIAAGKSIPFPQPSWAGQDFGTDGGMHNFLRYLEDRSNGAVNYAGSLISMYYSQYDTGVFKCCNSVYGAPARNYFFDNQFQDPTKLPPGTPMFQDVVSLSYHQNFTPQ